MKDPLHNHENESQIPPAGGGKPDAEAEDCGSVMAFCKKAKLEMEDRVVAARGKDSGG